jgi:hypothetical protein
VESDGAAIGVSRRAAGGENEENRGGFGARNQGWGWDFVRLEVDEIAFSVRDWAFVLLEVDEIACFGGRIGEFIHI